MINLHIFDCQSSPSSKHYIPYSIMTVSRLVAMQQMRKNWLKHEDRLIHIKSTLNTRLPISKMPSARKPNINKSLEVQLENKALLKKLTDRVHPREDVSMCCLSANPLPKSTRKRYYQDYRIRCENEGMYRRLKQTKPMIDLTAMRIQRAQTQKLLNTISKFGYKNQKPTKTLLKFDMRNNELKYLSRRKILIEQKMKEMEQEGRGEKSEEKIIEQELAKHKKTQKMFHFFSRARHLEIDGQQTIIKIMRGSNSIEIELGRTSDKQNNEGELQVSISKQLFKEKYHEDLQELIDKIRYNDKMKNFYIL